MTYDVIILGKQAGPVRPKIVLELTKCGDGAYLRVSGRSTIYFTSYGMMVIYGRSGESIYQQKLDKLNTGIGRTNEENSAT